MIVSINKDNSGKYHNLFKEAYQFLKNIDNGNYVDSNGTTFKNLPEYYGHMADFIAQGSTGYKYIMLPLDEEAFEINLNTRTIAIPASFSACASVQSDQLAETIMFIADRYFDYMDLATTEIFVQWETPADKANNIEAVQGATHIEMIDLESEPGKIKFAWPLNDIVTAVPGTVKFSIRFCRLDNSNVDKLFYSLNTLESSIKIKPALSASMPDDENKIEKPFGENLFKNAIVNSNYATEGVTPPTMPEFAAPGEDIFSSTGILTVGDAKITHLANDTVTLYAQAHTADINSLVEYAWYYKGAQDDTYYNCENYPTEESFATIEIDKQPVKKLIRAGKNAEGKYDVNVRMEENGQPVFVDNKDQLIYKSVVIGTVKQEDYLPCDMTKLAETGKVYREVYYWITNEDEAVLADGEPNPDYVPNYEEYDFEIDPEVTLYEKYTSFTVPSEVTITGSYKVAAWGIKEVSGKEDMKTHYPRLSSICTIPEPNAIILTNNLEAIEVLKDNKAALQIAVEDDPYKPVLTYSWQGSHAGIDSLKNIDKADKDNYEATDIGWYRVNVNSTVNRTPVSSSSVICKVINPVTPPRVTSINASGNLTVKADADLPINDIANGYANPVAAKEIVLHIDANVVAKDGYHPGLYTETEIDEKGNSTDKIKGFKYVWQMALPDNINNYQTIDRKMPGFIFDDNKPNELKVTPAVKNPVMSIRCLVVNTLNNQTAVFDHSCVGNVDPSIGNFPLTADKGEMQIPYIYENPVTEGFVFNVRTY